METTKQVKVAVIGAGGISCNIHMPALRELPEAMLCAVCDNVPGKAQSAADKFGIPVAYENYHRLLEVEKPDAVFVLVQPDQSFRIALDSMKAGAHVFIEKPAGITAYQAESLQRLAHAEKRVCQIGFNRRHIPLVKHVVERMREITPIQQVEGYFFKHGDAAFYDGCADAFMCDTIHALDCVRWIVGGRSPAPVRVTHTATVIMRNDSEVDNAWNSLMTFDNGVTATLKANYNTGGRTHGFEIHGPNASAYINIGFGGSSCDARILHFNGKGCFSLSSSMPNGVSAISDNIEYIDGIALAGQSDYFAYYGYKAEDKEFLTCAITGATPLCSIDEAVESMRLIEVLRASTL